MEHRLPIVTLRQNSDFKMVTSPAIWFITSNGFFACAQILLKALELTLYFNQNYPVSTTFFLLNFYMIFVFCDRLFDSSTETLVSKPILMSHEDSAQQQVSKPIEVSYKDITQHQVDVFTTVPDARELLDDEVRQLTLITKLENQNIFAKITARKQKRQRDSNRCK
jgi:hypothetical protein